MEGPEFDIIYNKYVYKVFYFVLRLSNDYLVAEEITQETFVKVYLSIDTFQGKCKLEVWICQIAKNLFFDYMKKRNYEFACECPEEKEICNYSDMDDIIINRESMERVNHFILNLKEPYRSILIDHVFAELNYDEMAFKYNKTPNWVRVNFYRAKQKLRELIENDQK